MILLRFRALSTAVLALSSASICAQTTTRVSVDSTGEEVDGYSDTSSLSEDGRYVAFSSDATDLVAGDTNGANDVFVHDRQTGETTRVSVSSGGTQANGDSTLPAISADGTCVVFMSVANNLVPGDANGFRDVFVHDRLTGATTRVSVDSAGAESNEASFRASISGDGRYVAFYAAASNLVPGDSNGSDDCFVHDRQLGTTVRVSVNSSGGQGNGDSMWSWIDQAGRCVTFTSLAANLVSGDTNGDLDVFVHDLQTAETTRASVTSSGTQVSGNSFFSTISGDGRHVAFSSGASSLVPGDTNGEGDVFVHDRQTGMTTRVSLSSDGGQGDFLSGGSYLSANGHYVSFYSVATNLVPDDTNSATDVFVHDRQTRTTTRVSLDSSGVQGDDDSLFATLSGDGRLVSFTSSATNLVPMDTNDADDIFVHELAPAAGFPVSCFGDGSGAPCGCGNESIPGWGSGCMNGLGLGAALTASGTASVTNDTLVLTSFGVPTQPGLFFQGDNLIGGGTGATFGDGIRCCGVNVVRLEVVVPPAPQPATASTSIVISQHAPPGTVNAGDTKCYQHWYRNPGTSPCGANFNLSNAVEVGWLP